MTAILIIPIIYIIKYIIFCVNAGNIKYAHGKPPNIPPHIIPNILGILIISQWKVFLFLISYQDLPHLQLLQIGSLHAPSYCFKYCLKLSLMDLPLLKDLLLSDYVFSHLESAIIESINVFVIPLF